MRLTATLLTYTGLALMLIAAPALAGGSDGRAAIQSKRASAQEISNGETEETTGLLLPAVQSAREAARSNSATSDQRDDDADVEGNDGLGNAAPIDALRVINHANPQATSDDDDGLIDADEVTTHRTTPGTRDHDVTSEEASDANTRLSTPDVIGLQELEN